MPHPSPPPLVSTDRIRRRVVELATAIETDREERKLLICVGILKGAIFFLADLARRLSNPVEIDFIQAASYGDGTSSGRVRILKDLELDVRGRDVLIVEDIVDTGRTLQAIRELVEGRGAACVKTCALLDKRARRQVEVLIDYTGFEIGDHFVVGYGLDHEERFRNLPYIGTLTGEEGEE